MEHLSIAIPLLSKLALSIAACLAVALIDHFSHPTAWTTSADAWYTEHCLRRLQKSILWTHQEWYGLQYCCLVFALFKIKSRDTEEDLLLTVSAYNGKRLKDQETVDDTKRDGMHVTEFLYRVSGYRKMHLHVSGNYKCSVSMAVISEISHHLTLRYINSKHQLITSSRTSLTGPKFPFSC